MLTLWIANKNYSSWSLRPWVAMREAGIDFVDRKIRFGDAAAWEVFRARSPNGLVPMLEDELRCKAAVCVHRVQRRHDRLQCGAWMSRVM